MPVTISDITSLKNRLILYLRAKTECGNPSRYLLYLPVHCPRYRRLHRIYLTSSMSQSQTPTSYKRSDHPTQSGTCSWSWSTVVDAILFPSRVPFLQDLCTTRTAQIYRRANHRRKKLRRRSCSFEVDVWDILTKKQNILSQPFNFPHD